MQLHALGDSRTPFPGESFLVSRPGPPASAPRGPRNPHFAIIDVGERLGAEAARCDPDVVAFTHDDDDHIGGAEQFFDGLRTMGRRPREFWLPADWLILEVAYAAAAGISPVAQDGPAQEVELTPGAIRAAIVDDADSLSDFFSFDGEVMRSYHERQDRRRNSHRDDQTDRLDEEIEARNAAVASVIESALQQGRLRVVIPTTVHQKRWRGTAKEIAERLVRRAYKIRRLIRRAMIHGNVRWFEVQSSERASRLWPTQGCPDYLTLVNAREVVPAKRIIVHGTDVLFFASQLTVQNRRALVLYAWPPPRQSKHGAIIWSDSDGVSCGVGTASRRTPWERTSLMTAPHHGSRQSAHRKIWTGRKSAGHPIGVLLSNNSRPTCPDYYRVRAKSRGCTVCASSTRRNSEIVAATLGPRGWAIDSNCAARGTCPVPWGRI